MIREAIKNSRVTIRDISNATRIDYERIRNIVSTATTSETEEEAVLILSYLLKRQQDNVDMISEGILHYNRK